ncbi:MAG TPA: FAD-binding protein [Nakamurella sp.]
MITAGPLSTTDLAATVRASIRGDVVTAEEPSFAAAAFGVAGIAPELVVVAADVTDVARAVTLAGRTGRRVVAQITGRRTAVTAEHTVLVVTRLLASVRVDGDRRTATVGIGASWRQVLDAAEPFGLTALSAAAEAGRGRTSRSRTSGFVFAADRIRSFEVVTATGDRRLVGPDSPDFFALRQGRTAPGLVVAMTLDLVVHPALTVAELSFAVADAPRVMDGWRRWSTGLPRTAVAGLATAPAGDTLVVRMASLGDRDRVQALLASLRTSIGVAPLAESVGSSTVAQVVRDAGTTPPRPALAA